MLDKLTMSAFDGTPLNYVLRDCGVTTVVLSGVALEIGIEPTGRHAADLGFIPVIAADACAAGDHARRGGGLSMLSSSQATPSSARPKTCVKRGQIGRTDGDPTSRPLGPEIVEGEEP